MNAHEVMHSRGLMNATKIVRTKASDSSEKKSKVVIIGDSHVRGYAAEIAHNLGKMFNVSGTVMPGSRLETITQLAKEEIDKLNDDVVIICGGANDINKNESTTGLRNIRNFVVNQKNTNTLLMTAPHRHDLPSHSCINMEVQVFNRKLYKVMKTMYHVTVIQTSLARDSFTRHGLHMNASGKTLMANIISNKIKSILTRSKIQPITLEWKSDQRDPTCEEIIHSFLQLVRSLFQSEFSTGCDLVLPLSTSSIYSFP
jgi:lysophospholipase L1-like esterase